MLLGPTDFSSSLGWKRECSSLKAFLTNGVRLVACCFLAAFQSGVKKESGVIRWLNQACMFSIPPRSHT